MTPEHSTSDPAEPSRVEQPASARADSPPPSSRQPWLLWLLFGVPFLVPWGRLLGGLQGEWSTNPQYSYGWVMPLLCLGALFGRFQKAAGGRAEAREAEEKLFTVMVLTLMAGLAFCYLPIRLVEEATPEWRPIQWGLGMVAIGLTLGGFYLAGGREALKRAAFPLLFFLVAIPWPTAVEEPIIQGLSRLNASLVVEVAGILGVPAVQHGNLIEVSTGVVGVNDACSGIRSFQSSLMISLFLGEINDLSTLRRMALVPAGFLLSILFNLGRTTFLTLMAAREGISAIGRYHDPAGVAIMIACLAAIWLLAFVLKPRKAASPGPDPAAAGAKLASGSCPRLALTAGLRKASLAMLAWILIAEGGVMAWYHFRESGIPEGPHWTVVFPTNNATFKELPMSPEATGLLRFDKGKSGQWQESDGTTWVSFFFEWLPGRAAGYLAKRHTPDICMPASGRELISGPDLMLMNINGVELPMRRYVFRTPAGSVHAYQCRWEAGVRGQYYANESARYNLIRGVWAGRGIHGQKVFEVVVTGCEDLEKSKQALIQQLQKLVRVEASPVEPKS